MSTNEPSHGLPHQRARRQRRSTAALLAALVSVLITAAPAAAQMLDDGVMLPARQLRTGLMYGTERWDEYWEGGLKRSNDNIGAVTTRSVSWNGAYGLTNRISLFARLPYVWTKASQGVLSGMEGRQDLTVALKYRLLQTTLADRATLRVMAVGGVGAPTSNYTPDFLPLSIGLHDRHALARASVYVKDRTGWFLDGFGGHVWRSNVQLDRSAYYTNGELVESSDVAMPNVFDYNAMVGWQRGRWCIPVGVSGQRTLGGGDIRRQDMPFVSNRMDFTKVHAELMYFLPMLPSIQIDLGVSHTLKGRNVGQSTMFSAGFTHVLHL